jgi:DNA-binding GntR family transcriptional regulator
MSASPPGEERIKRSQGLVEEVYAVLRGDIMSLRIPPDTRISVENLVRELGVSQTPIREALSMLEANGLVTKKHFVGYCTAPKLNRQQLDELFEIRLLIEPYAARAAAEKATPEELDELVSLAQSMEPAESRASYERFADQDSHFHSRLTALCGNTLIVNALSRLHTHLHIFRLRFHSEVTTEAFAEHAMLIQALQLRDPDMAEAAMRSHIRRSYDRLAPFADAVQPSDRS